MISTATYSLVLTGTLIGDKGVFTHCLFLNLCLPNILRTHCLPSYLLTHCLPTYPHPYPLPTYLPTPLPTAYLPSYSLPATCYPRRKRESYLIWQEESYLIWQEEACLIWQEEACLIWQEEAYLLWQEEAYAVDRFDAVYGGAQLRRVAVCFVSACVGLGRGRLR